MRAAQELFPDKASPTVELVRLLMLEGQDQEAEREVRIALGKLDGFAAVRALRGSLSSIYLYRGRFRDAIRETQTLRRRAVAEKDTNELAFRYAYEGLLMMLGWGWSDSAWSVASRALEFPESIQSNANITAILSWIQLSGNNWAFADSVSKARPATVGIFIDALAACQRGNPQEAQSAVEKLASQGIPPEPNQILHAMLAKCYLNAGEYSSALDIVSQVRKLPVARSETYVETFYLRGRAYEGLGEPGRARKEYEEFLRLWTNADLDLPGLVDAKRRLAALGTAS